MNGDVESLFVLEWKQSVYTNHLSESGKLPKNHQNEAP